MTAWVVAELAAGGLAASIVLGVAVGRVLRAAREDREAAGERPLVDDPEHLPPLEPPLGYRPRTWLVAGVRVVHPDYGLGTVTTAPIPGPASASPSVGVLFDDGTGRWVWPRDIDPITPDDERLYLRMLARRPHLPAQQDHREDHAR